MYWMLKESIFKYLFKVLYRTDIVGELLRKYIY